MRIPIVDVYQEIDTGFIMKKSNKLVRIDQIRVGDVIYMDGDQWLLNPADVSVVVKIEKITEHLYKINSINMYQYYEDVIEGGLREITQDELDSKYNIYTGTPNNIGYEIYRFSIKEVLEQI